MNKNDKSREKKSVEPKHKVGGCMSLGMCFGMLLGVVFDNISNGFIFGMLFGLVIDGVIQAIQKKRSSLCEYRGNQNES